MTTAENSTAANLLLKRKTDRRWLLAILAFALVLRIAAAFTWQSLAEQQGELFRFGDSDSYWYLAGTISDGQPYNYRGSGFMFRTPVYPIVLSSVVWIDSQRTAVLTARLLGCLLGTFCVWLCFGVAERVAGPTAARAAGLLAAVYPGAIGMSIFILSEAIFCPLLLGSLYCWTLANAQECGMKKRFLLTCLAGLFSGFAILARPSWILWPGFATLVLIATRPSLPSVKLCISYALAIAITLLPWWVRNYNISGQFVPTSSQVGASLYDSLHEGATGGSDEGMNFSGDFATKLTEELRTGKSGKLGQNAERIWFELEVDRRLKSAAIAWAWDNPSDVVRLGLIKFARTWAPLPRAPQLCNGLIRATEAVAYCGIVGLAVNGLLVVWRKKSPTKLRAAVLWFSLPCVYFAGIHCVFVGSVRYRQPAILALCVVAGIGAARIVVVCKNWIGNRRKMH